MKVFLPNYNSPHKRRIQNVLRALFQVSCGHSGGPSREKVVGSPRLERVGIGVTDFQEEKAYSVCNDHLTASLFPTF